MYLRLRPALLQAEQRQCRGGRYCMKQSTCDLYCTILHCTDLYCAVTPQLHRCALARDRSYFYTALTPH